MPSGGTAASGAELSAREDGAGAAATAAVTGPRYVTRQIRPRELRITHRHVEQRAVGLHVLHLYAFGRRHSGHSGDLVEDKVLGFLRSDIQLPASEADEVGKAGEKGQRGGGDNRALQCLGRR